MTKLSYRSSKCSDRGGKLRGLCLLQFNEKTQLIKTFDFVLRNGDRMALCSDLELIETQRNVRLVWVRLQPLMVTVHHIKSSQIIKLVLRWCEFVTSDRMPQGLIFSSVQENRETEFFWVTVLSFIKLIKELCYSMISLRIHESMNKSSIHFTTNHDINYLFTDESLMVTLSASSQLLRLELRWNLESYKICTVTRAFLILESKNRHTFMIRRPTLWLSFFLDSNWNGTKLYGFLTYYQPAWIYKKLLKTEKSITS